MNYLDFLRTKIEVAPVSGFALEEEALHPALKPPSGAASAPGAAGRSAGAV